MNELNNPHLSKNARELRSAMTPEERHLWYDFLKHLPITVHRQKTLGPYIVDFYCAKARLIIEVDGSQHYEKQGQRSDQKRDHFFQQHNLLVLRYSNREIHQQFDGVCNDILHHLSARANNGLPLL